MAFYSDVNYLKPEKGPLLEDVDDIYQSIYTILGTKPGQRLFRPTWGGHLGRYLFEPCDDLTAQSMLYDIAQTLSIEPRIELNTAKSVVTPVPQENAFDITLVFTIVGFGQYEQTLNLTYNQRN